MKHQARKLLNILLLLVMTAVFLSMSRVAQASVITYNVWVGSTQVTSENKDDILGDGKASFDPETNTLTLDAPPRSQILLKAHTTAFMQQGSTLPSRAR